jgi:copper transport protein
MRPSGSMASMTVDHPGSSRSRRAGFALAGLLVGLLCTLVVPASPASAHAALTTSDPAPEAVVPEAPNRVTLTFSESVQLVPDKIQVIGPSSDRIDEGTPTVSGNTVTVPLRAGGDKGTYLVSYRVISADSHPVAGAIVYSVGAPSTRPSAADATDKLDPAVKGPIPVAKYLGYAGLVLLVGPVLVLALLWPHRLSRRGPARLVWTGFGLVVASTLAGIWLQAPYTLGVGIFEVGPDELQTVLGSTYGAVMLVRLGVLCAAAVLLRPLLNGSGKESKVDLALLGVLGVAALATWPLTGHPSASPVAGVSVVVDAVHLASMAVWLGGLVMLVAFLLPRANARELGAILPIWSRWAAAAVGALIVAGTTQAIIEVGSFGGLVDTAYGQIILIKVGLAALVIGVAAFSRKLVRRAAAPAADAVPAADPDADADVDGEAETTDTGVVRTLRRLVGAELVVTAIILGFTAALVQIPPSRTAGTAASAATTTNVVTTLTAATLSLQAEIAPAQVGNNSVHLYAYEPDGTTPLPVVEWDVTAALPANKIEAIDVNLLRITDNHVIGDIALPMAGDWVFTFTLRTTEIDQVTVKTTVKSA